MEIITMLAFSVGLVGLFGWSHRSLNQKVTQSLSESQIRLLIDDKLAPIHIEYRSLSARIKELRESNKHLELKLDQILFDIRKLNGKN